MKLDQKFVRFLLIQIILASSISFMVTTGMKAVFAEPRPCELLDSCPETFSFPSRHTAIAFAAATVIVLAVGRKYLGVLAFAAAVLVGYWRIAIGFHMLNDILGGFVVGVIVGIGVYYYAKKFHWSRYRQK